MGIVEVLPTPAGGMLRDLYCAGLTELGMASWGWATLKERDGFIYVQPDFELITFDFVSDPSTGEYMKPMQRRYEQLRAPIDIQATYRSFMKYNQAAAAIAEREAVASPTTVAAAAAG